MNDAQIIAIVALATAGFLALWLWAIRAAKFPVNAYSGSAAGSRRGARCRRKKI